MQRCDFSKGERGRLICLNFSNAKRGPVISNFNTVKSIFCLTPEIVKINFDNFEFQARHNSKFPDNLFIYYIRFAQAVKDKSKTENLVEELERNLLKKFYRP